MKKNTSYIVFTIAAGFYLLTAISVPSKKEFVSNDKDRLLIELISHVIQRGHFNVKSLNDDMSEQIFHTYLENIDGQSIGLNCIFIISIWTLNFNKYYTYLLTTPPIYTNK